MTEFLQPPPKNMSEVNLEVSLRELARWCNGVYARLRGIGTTAAGVEMRDIVTLTPRTAPLVPLEGMVYADSATHHLYFYDGTNWKQLD